MQFVGRMFDEATILRVADAFERTTDWSGQRPPVSVLNSALR
jgi:aspartyl-tRNA(Asn)/glutamyl-tRNA(Gln) amidotransferase subunit A